MFCGVITYEHYFMFKLVLISDFVTYRHVQADTTIYRRLSQQTTSCSVCLKDVSPK